MHKTVLPDWVTERGRGYNTFPAFDPRSAALVVIDMQAAFVGVGEVFGNAHARDAITPCNALATAMRQAGAAVIWMRQTTSEQPPLAMPHWQYDRSDPFVAGAIAALRAGTPSHDLDPAMARAAGDLVLDKYRYSAFSCPQQALERTLRERGTEVLVMVGTLTNVCVESTAREANMRGWKVIVVSDACAAVTDEEHNAALMNLRLNFADVQSSAAVLAMLGAGAGAGA
ncbi:cysteine hydrolase family protein [Novosphingobium sp. KA1]|uniref:cysteine hydrolase family protein n=1 Tax=Novosphingobium sp. (strain KA1) TaxID=164608 RepID=UPI001A90A244|nr:cysteine hydrolase [Novosphingobium sp. KA1]QSR17232.1 isochorismatase [Novosphingobium sp. KA1]